MFPYFINTYLKERRVVRMEGVDYPIKQKNQKFRDEFNLINSINYALKNKDLDILKLSINDFKSKSILKNHSQFEDLKKAFQEKFIFRNIQIKLNYLANLIINMDEELIKNRELHKKHNMVEDYTESSDWELAIMEGNGDKFGL